MNTFRELFGFHEKRENVYRFLTVEDGRIKSSINGRDYSVGELLMPSLEELRALHKVGDGKLKFKPVLEDIRNIYPNPDNSGATFLVPSQFNLLQMSHPSIGPEQGISRYGRIWAQGPISALECLPATVYRNYFIEVEGEIGQTEKRQINLLKDLEEYLDNDKYDYWEMLNGYAILKNYKELEERIKNMSEGVRDAVKKKIRIGVQKDVDVTSVPEPHKVNQIFCSSLPLSLCNVEPKEIETFARILLDAQYEASILAAKYLCKSDRLFLTSVGREVYREPRQLSNDSINKAREKYKDIDMNLHTAFFKFLSSEMGQL